MQITIIDPPRRQPRNLDARTLRNWGACPDAAQLSDRELRACRVIAEMVADRFRLTPGDLFYRRRTARIALPRQVAMTLMRQVLHLPLQSIGRLFDRDHGTVIHATKAVASHNLSDPEFEATFRALHTAALEFSAS